jgi:hypothetical protein
MKKLITIISFIFTLSLTTHIYADYVTAYIWPKELEVHAEPNKESRTFDKVYGGQEIEVVEKKGDWAKVCIALDSYGWINAYDFEYHVYGSNESYNNGDNSLYNYSYSDDYDDSYNYSYYYNEDEEEENYNLPDEAYYDSSHYYDDDEEVPEVYYYYDEEADETVYYYEEEDEDTGETVRHTTTTSGDTTGSSIVEYAQQFVGNPYVWGGESLTNGADCSGFTQAVFSDMGISIGRTAAEQAEGGEEVDLDDIQAGDILYYYNDEGRIGHVTIYNGDGTVTHASNPENGIKISDVDYRTPAGARRYWTEEEEEEDYNNEDEEENNDNDNKELNIDDDEIEYINDESDLEEEGDEEDSLAGEEISYSDEEETEDDEEENDTENNEDEEEVFG